MRLRRIVLIAAGLIVLGAVLVGCGNKAHQLLGSGASGTTSGSVIDRSNATPNKILTETNLCGRVEMKDCDGNLVGIAKVHVTATWKDGPTLSTYTDDAGNYCFIGIIATGFDVDVCVDPTSLPPGITFVSTKYHQNAPNCQTVFLLYPNNVGDANFDYKKTDCGPPSGGECTVLGSINSNFNGTAIVGVSSGPAYVWFNSNISLKGMPAGTHVTLTNAQVIVNGTPQAVPNAIITFDNVPCATTTFDAGANVWRTTVPTAGSDEIFLAGLAWPTANLPGGAKVTFQGTFGTDRPGVCMSWKWGAAAYKTWTLDGGQPDYNAANIKPAHSGTCAYNNGDHAGTPENAMLKKAVTGGARGGGGSNFTGSWSSTGSACPPCAE